MWRFESVHSFGSVGNLYQKMHFAGSNLSTDPKCPKCIYKISKNFRVEKSGEISRNLRFSRFFVPASKSDTHHGWGGRIRTDECQSQSLVPYRLATPQYRDSGTGRPLAACPCGRGALFRCPIIISYSSASVKVYGRFFHAVGRKNAEKTRLLAGTGRRANLCDGGESPGGAFANSPADRAEEPGREGGSREASDGRAAGGREH